MASRNLRSNGKRKTEDPTHERSSSVTDPSTKKAKRNTDEADLTISRSRNEADSIETSDEKLEIIEATADIFAAPPNTLIIHACNCQGSWNAGIAKAFHDRYPKAYAEYANRCKKWRDSLLDSAQLIPPLDTQNAKGSDSASNNIGAPKHFVGCLFTSRKYGRAKDTPARILAATKPAMEDLLRKIEEWNASANEDEKIGEIRMCQINSGMFRVPWQKTKKTLQEIYVNESHVKTITVFSRPT